MNKVLSIVLLVLLACPLMSAGRTWHVEQDGSGDYTAIQAAVDVAAVGDTVLVEAGRYDEFHPVPEYLGADVSAVFDLETDSLTIRGEDRDIVLIGPLARSRTLQFGAVTRNVTQVRIENMTFENLDRGIHLSPLGEVAQCKFVGCEDGILGDRARRMLVEDCEFENDGEAIKVFGYDGGQEWCEIRSCTFTDDVAGITILSYPNANITNCTIRSISVGIKYVTGSTGTVRDCVIEGGNFGFYNGIGTDVEILDCFIRETQLSAIDIESGHIRGSGNVLGAGSENTITLSNASFDFHGNHIMPGTENSVKMWFYNIPDQNVDLTSNYWGASDSADLPGWIWDGEDDPSIQAVVQYEPIIDHPVGNDSRSVSSLKRMFR